MLNIGLMGFGRIGRNIYRLVHGRPDLHISVISDIANHKSLENLVRYDTILGPFPDEVTLKDGRLYAGGRSTQMLSEADPGQVPWGDLGIDIVIEATGKGRSRAECEAHLHAGAKKVLLCVPTDDDPDFTCIMGVNDSELKDEHRIISGGSVTANCAAFVLKLLGQEFGIQRVFFTTIHAYTNDQRLADVPAGDLRRSRAAAENIIPTDTKSPHALARLMPELEGKISGMALKVPVSNGSLIDMVTLTEKEVSAERINEVIKNAAGSRQYRKYLSYTDDAIVSSDIKHSSYSCVFDGLMTRTPQAKMAKTIAWYDNGWGYACRLLDLVDKLSEQSTQKGAAA